MVAVALRESTAVVLPSCDSTVAAAASHKSAVVVMGTHDSTAVAAVAGAPAAVAGSPATRAAPDRLRPSIICGWMSVNDKILGKFSIHFLLA